MMRITKLKISNFKSFNDLEVSLGRFNTIIGPNASGKTNFIQIFKFLKDIAAHGLDNAVSMQGGVEYLRNAKIGSSRELHLLIELEGRFGTLVKDAKGRLIGIKAHKFTYELTLEFVKRGSRVKRTLDKLVIRCTFSEMEKTKGHFRKEQRKIGDGEIVIEKINGKIDVRIEGVSDVSISKEELIPPFLKEVPKNSLLIEKEGSMLPFCYMLRIWLSNIAIYDFDPKLPKKAAPITGKAELEEDASNLSIVLKSILEDKDKKRKLFNLIKDLLPFVEDLSVEKLADKSLLFKLRETYFKEHYLPASLISDGTINVTALIIALYFEEKPITIIEEPERNIHPHLIGRVVDMMKDASRSKQIIVTTHNPEVIKYVGIDNLLLASRNEQGFSEIYRPNDREEIKAFLQSEIGIEELFVQNLLSI